MSFQTLIIIYILEPVVAFNAHTPTDKQPATNQVIVFSHPVFNIGNAYNSGTGVFTAPLTGVYMFTAHFCIVYQTEWYYAFVREEENVMVKGRMYDNDNNHCGTASAVIHLQKQERLWVECRSGPGADVFYDDTYRRNSFSGSLIHVAYE